NIGSWCGAPPVRPYAPGAGGPRPVVGPGGAGATACREIAKRAATIAGRLLQTDPAQVFIRDGQAVGPQGVVSLAEIARAWYLRPQDLPGDVDPGGLEATIGYKPARDTGTFSYATHAPLVAVDPQIADLDI